MATRTPEFGSPNDFLPARRRRADGSTLAAAYFLVLLLVPEGMAVSKIPIKVQPAVAVALVLGLLWVGAHMVNTLKMAKGRTLARTALILYFCAHLVTYGVGTRRGLLSDELRVADSSIIRITAIIGVGLFLCDGVRGWRGVDRVTKALTVGLGIGAGVGILQFAFGFDLVHYISIPGLYKTGIYDSIQKRDGFNRPAGLSNHPIEFGMLCAMGVPLSVYQVIRARDLRLPTKGWWLCLALTGGGVMAAVSRTAILCAVVSIVCLMIFLPGRKRLAVPAVVVAFVAVAAAIKPGLVGVLYKLVANAGDDPSVTGRTNDYPLVWLQIDRYPWFGRGFGTYFPDRYILLDNQYLNTLVENGYIGMFAFIGVLVAGALSALLARSITVDPHRRLLAATLFSSCLVGAVSAITFDLLAYTMVTGLIFGLAGLGGATLRAARESTNVSPGSRLVSTTQRLRAVIRGGSNPRPTPSTSKSELDQRS